MANKLTRVVKYLIDLEDKIESMKKELALCKKDYKLLEEIHLNFEEIHLQKSKFYSQLVSKGFVQLRPGIRGFLEKAKYKKKKLAISTSTSRDNVTLLLKSCLS